VTAVPGTGPTEVPATEHDTTTPSRWRRRAPDTGPGLAEYWSMLRRHRWLALTTFVVVLAVSIGSLLVIAPVYRAQAEVLLRTEDSRQLFPRTSGATPGALIRSPQAELVYVGGDAFQDRAVEAAGDDGEVEARNELGSSALVFVAEAGDAEAARAAAQTWAETYVSVRHDLDVAETTALRDLLVAERDGLEAQRQQVLGPVTALDDAIAAETDAAQALELLDRQLALQRSLAVQLEPVEAEIRRLDTQISGLDVDLAVLQDRAAIAYVSSAADLPEGRSNGSLGQSLLVGVLAGLVLAAGAVAAAERTTRR
jgi:uncharacterized protein involved in exopolysaccharide biosynthesis